MVRDSDGRITDGLTYTYDDLGRPDSVTGADPDGYGDLEAPVTYYIYFPNANVLAFTIDPNGNVTEDNYDSRYRLISIVGQDPDGEGPLQSPTTVYRPPRAIIEQPTASDVGSSRPYPASQYLSGVNSNRLLTRESESSRPEYEGRRGTLWVPCRPSFISRELESSAPLGYDGVNPWDKGV